MLGKTTILAIRVLLYLGERSTGTSVSPRLIAEQLGESPSYLAKVCRLLVKAGILRAQKGVRGGVRLSRAPSEMTLLSVVEACQGTITGDYCLGERRLEETCSFHRAAVELYGAITSVLTQWTLAQLLERPRPAPGFLTEAECVMANRRTI